MCSGGEKEEEGTGDSKTLSEKKLQVKVEEESCLKGKTDS